jgi:hemolysin III
MGWIGVIATRPLLQKLPPGALTLLIAGGLAYSLGVPFYLWHGLRYHHVLWHLFVLAGSICHFFAILVYVI